jgi:D-3-phosphoglycerate dehydrogenase
MRILILSSIDKNALRQLSQKHDTVYHINPSPQALLELVRDRQVLIFRSGVDISSEVLGNAPFLKLLIRAGCGLDNIDLDYAQAHDVVIRTIPQPAAFAVAELTFAHLLTLARRTFEANQSMQKGEWKKNDLYGTLLTGKTLGIIGVGNIGTRVGQLGVAWGMRVIGYDIRNSQERIDELKEFGIELMDFDTVLAEADFLTLHTPLNETSYHLIDAQALAKMKQGAFLLNMARGGVVDEKALYRELTEVKKLAGAGLDVHEKEGAGKFSPFVGMSNVVLSPHIGSTTFDTQRDIGRRIIAILNDFEKKQSSQPGKKLAAVA